jgi:5'-nucleotidase
MEGTVNGIRSIAISMAMFVSGSPIHYETGALWLDENWDMLVNAPLTDLSFLNVNVPNILYPELRGHKVVPMGRRVYQDRVEPRSDPWGRPYYWQGGVVVMNSSQQPGTDVAAVSEGFVSITPVTLDWTDYSLIDTLERSLRR